MTRPSILVVNAGSSSVKVSLFEATSELPLIASGRITGIGTQPALDWNGAFVRALPRGIDQADALGELLQQIHQAEMGGALVAVGHRIVHGGNQYTTPTRLTAEVLQTLETFISLAPLHQPSNLSAVRSIARLEPDLLQIGCFDTSFHAHRSPLFRHYALPKPLRDQGILRYGFHGLSYEWIARVLKADNPAMASGRVVAAHLGNGASLCAMQSGQSIDTTMGMTTLDGLPMGTRCGSIDPGVILFLARQLQWDVDRIEQVLSRESGLLGLSGISSDMRELLADGREAAQFAVDYFAMAVAQHVARMAVALGGMDALVFTGGIGEHAASVRTAITQNLQFLPPFAVLVIATNEERMIAEHCWSFLQ